jgi:protein O-GlcNAc transferase
VASVLETVGLQNLVGRSAQEYISIARDLAMSIDRLETLRRSLRTTVSTSGLCDGRRFTQGLEAAYRTMWRAWCENG